MNCRQFIFNKTPPFAKFLKLSTLNHAIKILEPFSLNCFHAFDMPRGKPKGNKDKGATCSDAGGDPSSLDSRKRKRRAESQLDFQQPTLSAIQVTQVPPTAVDEHQQAATSTGIENPTTSASTWQDVSMVSDQGQFYGFSPLPHSWMRG